MMHMDSASAHATLAAIWSVQLALAAVAPWGAGIPDVLPVPGALPPHLLEPLESLLRGMLVSEAAAPNLLPLRAPPGRLGLHRQDRIVAVELFDLTHPRPR